MPEMQPLKPCARCEQELPEAFFDTHEAVYCKRCAEEMTSIIREKYNVIEAAHFRAQLRRSGKALKSRLTELTDIHHQQQAAAGD